MRIANKRLITNAVVMTITSLLMRGIGMGFTAYLAGRIGAEGVGLFQLVMSVYSMAIMLSVSGMRITSTRLNTEALAMGRSPRRVLAACLRTSGTLGLFALALLNALSGVAARLLGNPSAAPMLRMLSLALPFVAMSTSLAGCMAARRRMGVHGIVQALEQVCRVGLTIAALRLVPEGSGYALWAVTFGIVAAEAVSFALSLAACMADLRHDAPAPREHGLMKRIVHIALPEAMGSWLRSALSTAEQMLIPRQLGAASPGGNALATYGVIQGMAMPVITLPTAPVYAMASLLVPELAQMRVLGERARIKRAVNRAIRLTLLYSVAAAALIFVFAGPIGSGVYKNDQASVYIRALAPLIPMLYTDSVVDHMLKSLDQQAYCMKLNTVDCALRVAYVLFILPLGGTTAFIALIYLSEAFNFALSLNKLLRVVKQRE